LGDAIKVALPGRIRVRLGILDRRGPHYTGGVAWKDNARVGYGAQTR
jgi:hypothetical protein